MKIKLLLTAACLAWGASLRAAPLSATTAVQSKPDPASPVITVLSAGAEEPVRSDKAGPAPDGWSAVEVPGPFEGYVRNRDLTKQLDVSPGSSIYLSPADDAGLLAVFEKGDKAEITGLHGAWTQVRLEKTLIGYIRTGPAVVSAAPAAPVAAPVAAAAPQAPSASAAPAAPAPSEPAGSSAGLSRLFEGTLTGTRTLLSPRQPYPWQLVDPSGSRIAYIDLTKLLLTDQIENYAGHAVVVLGSFGPVKDSPDIVIEVEALRLK
ncbi:MAG TPA: hypothetical protein VN877_06075 [Opitutaceae bacterium]|nr:hypothetical protein [Opitutaceae bacterium]